MNDDKWKFAEPDPNEKSAAQKEREGMIVLLILGAILFAGGLYFAYKIGVFDLNSFWELDREKTINYHSTRDKVIEYSLFFHAPWMTGAWMIRTAIKSFLKNGIIIKNKK